MAGTPQIVVIGNRAYSVHPGWEDRIYITVQPIGTPHVATAHFYGHHYEVAKVTEPVKKLIDDLCSMLGEFTKTTVSKAREDGLLVPPRFFESWVCWLAQKLGYGDMEVYTCVSSIVNKYHEEFRVHYLQIEDLFARFNSEWSSRGIVASYHGNKLTQSSFRSDREPSVKVTIKFPDVLVPVERVLPVE